MKFLLSLILALLCLAPCAQAQKPVIFGLGNGAVQVNQYPRGATVLSSQKAVDNFVLQYSNVSFRGYLVITGQRVYSLKGLAVVNLSLSGIHIDNTSLQSLAGLENLAVTRRLIVENNQRLRSLDPLAENIIISGSLTITNNAQLSTCFGAGICDALAGNGPIVIANNAGNCLDEAEARRWCDFDACHPDMYAMMKFYQALDGENWTDNTGWADAWAGNLCDPCGFSYVDCLTDRVHGLRTSNENLNGLFPPEITRLTELKYLFLGGNNLSGQLPSDLNRLTQLGEFFISSSSMHGSIPDLTGLDRLYKLRLTDNRFSGSFPAGLENIGYNPTPWYPCNESEIDVRGNNLSGELPKFTYPPYWLIVNDNNFTGCYPDSYEVYCTTSLCPLISYYFLSTGNPNLANGVPFEVTFCNNQDACGNPITPLTAESVARVDPDEIPRAYPNPTDGTVTLFRQEAGQAALYDAQGRQLRLFRHPGNGPFRIVLPTESGVYFVRYPSTGEAIRLIRR